MVNASSYLIKGTRLLSGKFLFLVKNKSWIFWTALYFMYLISISIKVYTADFYELRIISLSFLWSTALLLSLFYELTGSERIELITIYVASFALFSGLWLYSFEPFDKISMIHPPFWLLSEFLIFKRIMPGLDNKRRKTSA